MNTDSEKEVPITIADIMTEDIVCLREDDNITTISEGMDRYNLRHLLVVREENLVGIVSHRDLLRLAVSSLEANTPEGRAKQDSLNQNTLVAAVMTRDPVTVRPDTPIWEAAKIMVESKFGCLPVVDRDDNVAGIVTEHDFLKILAQ